MTVEDRQGGDPDPLRDALAKGLADALTIDWPGDTRLTTAPAIADYLLKRPEVRAALRAMRWTLPLVLAVRAWRDTPRTTKDMRLSQRLEQAILDAIGDLDEYARLSTEADQAETPR